MMFLKLTKLNTRIGTYGAIVVDSWQPIVVNMNNVNTLIPYEQVWTEEVEDSYNILTSTETRYPIKQEFKSTVIQMNKQEFHVKESIEFIMTAMKVKEEEN